MICSEIYFLATHLHTFIMSTIDKIADCDPRLYCLIYGVAVRDDDLAEYNRRFSNICKISGKAFQTFHQRIEISRIFPQGMVCGHNGYRYGSLADGLTYKRTHDEIEDILEEPLSPGPMTNGLVSFMARELCTMEIASFMKDGGSNPHKHELTIDPRTFACMLIRRHIDRPIPPGTPETAPPTCGDNAGKLAEVDPPTLDSGEYVLKCRAIAHHLDTACKYDIRLYSTTSMDANVYPPHVIEMFERFQIKVGEKYSPK